MSYRDLIQKLIADSSKATVYRHINKKRKEYNMLISQEDAAYIIAAEREIDLFDYLEPDAVERIRHIMAQHTSSKSKAPVPTTGQATREVSSTKKKTRQDKLALDVDSILVQNLPSNIVKEAKEMANVYPLFYILENSIRVFILDILKKSFGKDWWEKSQISSGIRKNVTKRMADDERAKWHGRRKAHPIFYVNTGDLSRIIETNWEYFKDTGISNPQWVNTYITEIIERSRNIVMHCNPLPKRDITRLRVIFEDWMSIINTNNMDLEIDAENESIQSIKTPQKQPGDSIADYIEKNTTGRIHSVLKELADKRLISFHGGQLKIDKKINLLQARVLVSLLVYHPSGRSFIEVHDDVLYPVFAIEGGDARASVRHAIKKLLRRKVIEYQNRNYVIPTNKLDEAIGYVDY
jgi:hypothetical protein